jgi:GEVED domain/Secretion system C-terminal sorting domain
MGHYYGLYHTHGKSNCGTTDELVNDPNCARTGDDVCDTPADPNLLGLFCSESLVDSATCMYIGTEVDRIGNPFQPDPSNIMAYTWEHCTTRFTPGQYERMRFFAENVRLYAEDCSGRKICPIPQVAASQLSPGSMQFDWTAGSASVFQARYRLGEDTTWIPLKAIYGNKWLAYDLGPCTRIEFQIRAQCESAYTNWSASTLAFTKGCANNDGYCTSLGGSENVWINQLSLGEWSNKTGDDGGYALFTPNDLNITAGKSYTIALQPGGFIRARDTLYWRVWVDFNRDKDFNDPGEQVFQAKSRGRSSIVKGNLAFPDSLAGTYRMRISLSKGRQVDACGKGGIVLETEDYEWAITTPGTGLVESALQLNPLGITAELGAPQLRIIPNPNTGLFTLQVPNTLHGEGQVLVFNSTGQQVHQARLNFSAGLPAQVRLAGQAPGVYFLRLQVGQAVFSERLILLHP